MYEYSTLPDTSVLYGRTRVSHISVNGCPHIKRLKEKELNKKTIGSYKETLNTNEVSLVDEVTEWISMPIFKSFLSKEKNYLRVASALKKYGYEKLMKTYKNIAIRGGDPHPKKFWEELES